LVIIILIANTKTIVIVVSAATSDDVRIISTAPTSTQLQSLWNCLNELPFVLVCHDGGREADARRDVTILRANTGQWTSLTYLFFGARPTRKRTHFNFNMAAPSTVAPETM